MLPLLLTLAMTATTTASDDWYAASGFPQYPSLTPDGSHVMYSDRGDLWSMPIKGGQPHRLTTHPAEELRSAVSPDGSLLAFSSNRDGITNLYVMPITQRDGQLVGNGPIRRVTTSDRTQILSGFSPDGESLLLHAYADPTIYRSPMMYRAPLDGGPMTRIVDAHGRSPRLSADGSQLLFTRGNAPWERPAYRGSANREAWSYTPADGAFTRLTDALSNDGQAFARPDGSIVLLSSRDGQNDVWLIDAQSDFEEAHNLTNFKPESDATIGHGARDLAVSDDGSTAVYGLWDGLEVLDLTTADPLAVAIPMSGAHDLSTLDRKLVSLNSKVSEVATHPSGEAVAVVARGEVLVRSTTDDHPTRRVTQDHARQRHIAWSPDGTRLWFTSDQDGDDAIWEATVSLTRDDLTPEEEEEEEEEDTTSDEESADQDDNDDATDVESDPSEDEHNDADDTDHSDTDAADDDTSEDKAPKKPKNKTGSSWAGALRFDTHKVIDGPAVSRPMPSPDGRRLLYQRNRGDLVLRDLQTGEDTVILESWDEPEVRWASDSQHIVYSVADLDFNNDIWLMNVNAPDTAVNLTQHPDIDRAPRISDDGSRIVFLSDRNRIGDNWEWDVWTIPLDASLEDLTTYQLDQRIKDAAKTAGKKKILPVVDAQSEEGDADKDDSTEPLAFEDLDTAWRRASRVASHEGEENNLELTAGGDHIIYSGEVDGSKGLWRVDHRGDNRKKITSGSVSNVKANATGKQLSFVAGGVAKHAPAAGGKVESWPIDADARIEVASEQGQKFDETARIFGRTFYHPTMKGLNWDALSDRYGSLASSTRTSQAFNRVVDHLFGEVNGSHTGIYGGFSHSGPKQSIGYLGIETTPVEDGHRVIRVIDDGPSDVTDGPQIGDVVTMIDDRSLAGRDLTAAMEGTANNETLVTVTGTDGTERMMLLTPTSWGKWSALMRADEIEMRRDAVAQASDDRIGYLHIRGMNMPSVHQFEHDLYAAAHGKDGLLIDVRDNGGGFTTDILLASLTAPTHAFTIPRGAKMDDVRPDSYPRDRRLLYAYSRPVVVLCNENSFSNAEIFSHAIQNTDRGTLVGEETFGGVISTGGFTLIDGTRVRQPFRGWYLPDGTDMESRGAIPDVRIQRMPGDEAAGVDAQLDAAIRTLLKKLPNEPIAVHPRPAS